SPASLATTPPVSPARPANGRRGAAPANAKQSRTLLIAEAPVVVGATGGSSPATATGTSPNCLTGSRDVGRAIRCRTAPSERVVDSAGYVPYMRCCNV